MSHAWTRLALVAMGALLGCGPAGSGGLAVQARYVLPAPDGSCPETYQPNPAGTPPPGATSVLLRVSGGGLESERVDESPAAAERIAVDDLPPGHDYRLDVFVLDGSVVSWIGTATRIQVRAGTSTVVRVFLTRTGGLTCAAGAMQHPRFHHTATLMRTGEVLVVGGFTAIGDDCGVGCVELEATDTAEIFSPETGEFRATGRLHHARAMHTAAALPDGRVLVVGGTGHGAEYDALRPFGESYLRPSDEALTTYEIWDPLLDGFSAPAPLTPGRVRAASTVLPDGRVLIAGGLDLGGTQWGRADAAIFDPALPDGGAFTGEQISLRAAGGRLGSSLDAVPTGYALLWGGTGSSNYAELFLPGAVDVPDRFQTFRAQDARGLSSLLHASTLLSDGRILISGGVLGDGTTYQEPSAESTRLVSTAGEGLILDHRNGGPRSVAGRFAHAAAALPDGSALVAGGYGALAGPPLATLETWISGSAVFTSGPALSEARAHLTATPLLDDTVLLVGGRAGAAEVSRAAEIYRPD